MFTNLIGTLTGLLPKNFFFGSYVPVLIFGYINGFLLYVHAAAFREFFNFRLANPLTFATLVLFVASLIIAYILSSVTDFLREVLEGKHLLPGYISDRLRERQRLKLNAVETAYENAREVVAGVGQAQVDEWLNRLIEAQTAGTSDHPGAMAYRGSFNVRASASVASLRRLRHAVNSQGAIAKADLEQAVREMAETLRLFDAGRDKRLAADRDELIKLIEDCTKAAETLQLRIFTLRQTYFGNLTPEPTGMGNIAAAIGGYAVTRYGFDLDTFWSRLVPTLQKNDAQAYGDLRDAKTQLDFLVTCCWLTLLTWAVWTAALAAFGTSIATFTLVAVAGPIFAVSFYLLAKTNYITYGQLVRASVDLNRFALLTALRIPIPAGIREERALWSALRQLSSFGTEDVELSYTREQR